jgi:hypothetical protein
MSRISREEREWRKAEAAGRVVRMPVPKRVEARLRRQMKDIVDPTRYLVRSADTAGFTFWYRVEDDMYACAPEDATLFKRKWVAKAVADRISSRPDRTRRKRSRYVVIKAMKLKGGKLLMGKKARGSSFGKKRLRRVS